MLKTELNFAPLRIRTCFAPLSKNIEDLGILARVGIHVCGRYFNFKTKLSKCLENVVQSAKIMKLRYCVNLIIPVDYICLHILCKNLRNVMESDIGI